MPRFFYAQTMKVTALSVAILCTGSAAFAQMTPAEVWAEWKTYLTDQSYVVTGTAATDGTTLVINDVTLKLDIDGGTGPISAALKAPSFTFAPDGSAVRFTMAEGSQITLTAATDDGMTLVAALDLEHEALAIRVSGSPADMLSEMSATQLGLDLAELVVDDMPIWREVADFNIAVADVSSSTRMAFDGMRQVEQNLETGPLSYTVAGNNLGTGEAFAITGGTQSIRMSSVLRLPQIADPSDVAALLAAGLQFDGTLSCAGSSGTLNLRTPNGNGNFTGAIDASTWDITLSGTQASYTTEYRGVALSGLMSQMPIPFAFNVDKIGFGADLPVLPSETGQNIQMRAAMEGFTMADVLWGMFDPQAKLPRDPATVIIDLAGEARLLLDVFDTDLTDLSSTTGRLDRLEIKELNAQAAGATLDASGDMRFDYSAAGAFGNMPKTVGEVDIDLVGANTLLDRLVDIGLVPPDAAGAARMMIGLFGMPGAGEDTLKSKLEINEKGHILANGNRIQ